MNILKAIKNEIVEMWQYFWKIFSADPVASCSRMLATGCLLYVIWKGNQKFDTLTPVQSQYLIGVMGGVLPYALDKMGSVVKSLRGE